MPLCYGARLASRLHPNFSPNTGHRTPSAIFLGNIVQYVCHAFCLILIHLALLAVGAFSEPLAAQDFRPGLTPPPATTTLSPNVNKPVVPWRAPTLPPDAHDHVFIESVSQEVDGPVRHLRGMVRIETSDMRLRADELDYNSDTGDVQARGHVHLDQFTRGEKIDCDRADYNVNTDEGKSLRRQRHVHVAASKPARGF